MPLDITTILWALAGGIAVAAFYTLFMKKAVGGFVRKLLALDATSPDTALAFRPGFILRFALREGGTLSRTVHQNDNGEYFIPPEQVARARARYRAEKGAALTVLIIVLVIVIGILICSYAFPQLIERLENTLASLF